MKETETHIKPQKRLYSINDASAYMGQNVWAIREMLRAGKISYVRDGKLMLLYMLDMDCWIEKTKLSTPIVVKMICG